MTRKKTVIMNIVRVIKKNLIIKLLLFVLAITIGIKVIMFNPQTKHSNNRMFVLGRKGLINIYKKATAKAELLKTDTHPHGTNSRNSTMQLNTNATDTRVGLKDRPKQSKGDLSSKDIETWPISRYRVKLHDLSTQSITDIYHNDLVEKYNKVLEKRLEREIARKTVEGKKLTEAPNLKPVHFISREKLKIAQIHKDIVSWSYLRRENSSLDPLLNLHKFSYGLNSHACIPSPDVIIFVQSATENFENRVRIRRTWGNIRHFRQLSFETLFMVGQSDLPSVRASLKNESIINGDIVQGNFTDTYKNLTYKHIMALGWITENCPKVKVIVKVDDDTILNIFNLVKHITDSGSGHTSIYCSVFYHQSSLRNPDNKWYVSTRDYPFQKYPDYCEGVGYIMSPDGARTLYKASADARFYWVDDVYITGILALKGGVSLTDFHHRHRYIRGGGRMDVDSLFVAATVHNWYQLWNLVVNAQLS